ncbi:FAD-binding oxidoreductase [Planctomicrobium sp. SH661]|uniref:FAD-binding oxidoreductase n=1 Tax=Planctomicrobium sp. SH661 TaxID=3448124 RepID=UPI003F5BBABC
MIAENFHGPRLPLMPVGGRTALRFGGAVCGSPAVIVTEGLNRVVDYPARDMTITVEAGMRVDDLQEILAKEDQFLPIDIAQSHRATIGGAIATNASGPARFGYGTFRDSVIGISAIDGQGRLFSAGGRVVKNVAGYDLCKLMIGSLGTLGVITQVTLKLPPRPHSRLFVVVRSQQLSQLETVLENLNLSATRPVIIDLLNAKAVRQLRAEARQDLPSDPYLLCIGYAGSAVETAWQAQALAGELKKGNVVAPVILEGDSAEKLWKGLTEYQAASDDPMTFQATMLPSKVVQFVDQCTQAKIAVQSHAGSGIVIGHVPDSCAEPSTAASLLDPLRQLVRSSGGSLVILNCDDNWNTQLDLFGTPLNSEPLIRKLKQTFDPANVLNPGRI